MTDEEVMKYLIEVSNGKEEQKTQGNRTIYRHGNS